MRIIMCFEKDFSWKIEINGDAAYTRFITEEAIFFFVVLMSIYIFHINIAYAHGTSRREVRRDYLLNCVSAPHTHARAHKLTHARTNPAARFISTRYYNIIISSLYAVEVNNIYE
jgi:hypothetical protein